MTAFTKGPWVANKYSVFGPNTRVVAYARGLNSKGRTPEDEANARLIAAAPDLLSACKAVVEEDGFRGSFLMRKRIDAMKAAIAKAEPIP